MATYKLSYFDVPGVAEPIRFLFHYGGIQFEDNRINKLNWSDLKQTFPFGQVPVLEHNGKVINQSRAISRYVAKLVNLTGNDDWENLEIDSIVDTFEDLRDHFRKYTFETNPEKKMELKKKLDDEILPFYLTRIEEQIKNNGGFLVGGHLTWADLFVVAHIDSFIQKYEQDVTIGRPNLKKLKEHVLSLDNIKEYISQRPKF
ncbi:glutathione S-transferase-like [Aethina tumida]|uniref:glutathione S-transferase-like n=1 Tax=Aethina tumida TaxID=116153 RepID=UPI0021490BEE|nr:glutathione S-transferase-like [Aethina tumida]